MKNKYNGLEIAIIGMSVHFPESSNYRRFWNNLAQGKELIKTFTDDELRNTGVPEEVLQNKLYVKSEGIINDKDCFDNVFFGYSAEEAALMDPQIRLFHEHCWKALEDAGYASFQNKKIGLFAGAAINDNWKIYVYGKAKESALDPFYVNMIKSQSFINSLVSYKLNLSGPSYYVDTACSTSLSAIHLACRSLLTRESALALAGGVCLRTRKQKGYFYKEGMIASKDGHCRTFDASASGTAAGEGVGVVVLKRLAEAINDKDHIYAIIRSTSVNNDGNNKVGYTAPGVKGQIECITAAHKLAGIEARTVSYIEAHGTATNLGDPAEIRALNEAFNSGGNDKFCAIGSVKSNMGHLDVAAGVAGLIKTALSLKYKQIAASLHFKEPNPEIEFDEGPFYVNTELKPWLSENDIPLRAGVSSLGIGGTNVHAVLEEAPVPEKGSAGRHCKLLNISAKTETALLRYMSDLKNFLEEEPDTDLADMSYTLQVGRKHFIYRKSVLYKNREDLINLLKAAETKGQLLKCSERNKDVVFMFPGQGSQYEGMSQDLYKKEPLFREEMDRGFLLFEKWTGERLQEIIFPQEHGLNKINDTRYTQPVLFVVEHALARYLIAIGISPRYMIGHSIGEYVAACISGLFTFEDALRLVIKRGELMNRLPSGAMVSIPIAAQEAVGYLNKDISLAAVNAPEQVVLSGDHSSIALLINKLNEQNIPHVKLHTSHAFHSSLQDPMLDAFENEVKKVTFNKLHSPFISNLTGTFITQEEVASPAYWVQHLRETVKFSDGINKLLSQNQELIFIEVGAGRSLSGLLKQHKAGKSHPVSANLVRSVKETTDDLEYLTNNIGQLWANGVKIDWDVYYKDEKRNRVSLPTYSFEPFRFPAEVNPFEAGLSSGMGISGNIDGHELKDRFYFPSWKRSVATGTPPIHAKKTFLFFSFDKSFSRSLANELLKDNHTIVEVYTGKEFEKISAVQYILDPGHEDHIEKLLSELNNDHIVVTDVLYSCGIGVDDSTIALTADDKALKQLFFNIVNIIQCVANNHLTAIRLVLLTNALHKVTGNEDGAYAQSLQLGLMNVIAQEYSILCANMDIDLNEKAALAFEKLAAELNSRDKAQVRIMAIRNGYSWVPYYQKNDEVVKVENSIIKKGGVYLITGGLGNVGFTLARHLIEKYQAKIILMGRKKMTVPETNGRIEEHVKRYNYLKAITNDVKYIRADIANINDVKKALLQGENEWGTIQGVIHTAGVVENNSFELIEDITTEKVLATLAPKVKGIENIYTVFQGRMPDFVWITSSIASLLGGLSFSAYSAANLFMDHFIYSKASELKNWKCINLSGLAFTDDEMQQSPQLLQPADIIALFEWSLTVKNCPVIIETSGDLAARIRKTYEERKAPVSTDAPYEAIQIKAERPDLTSRYVAPETTTENRLAGVFEDFFGFEKMGVEDNFFELGGDSLKAMILLKRIKKEFTVSLVLKDFLLNATIKGIAAKIDELSWLESDVKKENEIII